MARSEALHLYVHEVSRRVRCSGAAKQALQKDLRLSLGELPGVEEMSYGALLGHVDAPEVVAAEYAAVVPGVRLRRLLTRRQKIIIAVASVLVAAFVVWFANYMRGVIEYVNAYTVESPAIEGSLQPDEDDLHHPGVKMYF